jgi:predicted ATPase
MVGKYYIEISNRKLKYKLEIERKITLIKGNSGTGKITLIRMLQGYIEQGNKSGIKIKVDKFLEYYPIKIYKAIYETGVKYA